MAILIPSREIIEKQNQEPTPGELTILNFLEKNLDDSFEVYYQPHLNGDLPDVVIMRRGYGVLVIEVKDYNLDLYNVVSTETWTVTTAQGKRQTITSPVWQAYKYKRDFYNLYISGLAEKKVENIGYKNVVRCAVFLSQTGQPQINDFLNHSGPDGKKNGQKITRHYLDEVKLFGKDRLEKTAFEKFLEVQGLFNADNKPNQFFTEDLYQQFRSVLQPTQHAIDRAARESHTYERNQREIMESRAGRHKKVRGIAGSGKTEVLANLAVNACLRINGNKRFRPEDVLILTFNITLRNYIHDHINNVRKKFPWSAFTILHYHAFIDQYWGKYLTGTPRPGHDNFEARYIFPELPAEHFTKKYKVILVDEIQDYKKEWVESIWKVLAPDGEIVFFGDEKQNVYDRVMEINDVQQKNIVKKVKRPYTKIPGNWTFFKKTYRINNEIADLANLFQQEFYKEKYEYDRIENFQAGLFEQPEKWYYYMDEINVDAIVEIYRSIQKQKKLNPNDICFLGLSVKNMRLIEQKLRKDFLLKTRTTFETEEMFQQLKRYANHKERVEEIRRNRKFNFWMESGTVKLSTVHSFKGWELQTGILLIDEDDLNVEDYKGESEKTSAGKTTTDELLYTALTRVRENLVVINIGNKKYDGFFRKNMPVYESPKTERQEKAVLENQIAV